MLVTIIITGLGCSTTVRLNPRLEEKRDNIYSVGLMPGKANIVLVKFKGDNERLTEKEEATCAELERWVKMELNMLGWSVINADMGIESEDIDNDFRFTVSSLDKECNRVLGSLYKRPTWFTGQAKKCTSYTLGPDINILADRYEADALVFLRYRGFEKSGGEIAKDAAKSILIGIATLGSAVPIYYSRGGEVFVMLVDGDSGDMLWSNSASMAQGISLEGMIRRVFKGFPKKKTK
jgi:hypothetical protein